MTSRATLLAALRASCAVIALAAAGAPVHSLAGADFDHERLSGGRGDDDGDRGGGDRDGGGGDRDGGDRDGGGGDRDSGGDRDGGGGDRDDGGDRDGGGGDSGDRDGGDRDSSGSGSGEDRDSGDRDSSGSGSGEDRDGEDRDSSGSGSGDDDRSGSDDDRSGSDSGSDDDRSGSGDDDDRSGSDDDDDRSRSDDDGRSGSDDDGADDHGGSDDAVDDHGGDSRSDYDEDEDQAEDRGGSADAAEAGRGASVAALDLSFDDGGREYREHEIVLVANEDELAAVRRLGLPILQDRALAALGGGVVRIQVPEGQSTEAVLAQVKAAAPQGAADLNTVYRLAGKARALPRSAAPATRFYGSVGMIDTAVERRHPAVRAAVVESRSFAAGRAEPAAHGTAVAYLTAGAGAKVLAADVFTLDAKGGPAASADAMARAVNWLASRGVAVINLSIAGPPNAALAEVIRRAQAKGIVVVAAAGNAGPAAPPAYPAAYSSVVAVTAVDGRHKVYRYANQGKYIVFAARGVDVTAPEGSKPTSGTSFAAPLVSATIAADLSRQDPKTAAAVLERLKKRAKDLGAPGLDPIYGYGMIQPRSGRR
ncbi:MAG TPA: S8 family serine peptidase [Caulobacteraceae bacterium]|jgi:hypothetical protein